MTKIDKQIVSVAVIEPAKPAQEALHERMARPAVLTGATYKVKTPLSEHALYITINDMVLNAGTEHESRQPFEMFINSKAMEHFQWIVALTRIVSAVFRKGGDMTFLVGELHSVFDPKGGYFKSGKYRPSLVSEIGDVIETHLTGLGLIKKDDSLAIAARAMVAEKSADAFPADATVCGKCSAKSVVIMDGCQTCLNCGDSKCG